MPKTLPRKKVVIEFDLDLYEIGWDAPNRVMVDFEHDISTLKSDIGTYFAGKVNVTKVQISDF